MTDVQEQQRKTYRAWLRTHGEIPQHPAESTASRILSELETLEKRGERIAAQLRSTAGDDVSRRRAEAQLSAIEDGELQLYELLDQFPEEHVAATVAQRASNHNRYRR
jgi:hypothetical protein